MDYEKKYKEALERAKDCLKDCTITNTAIDYISTIFPELRESEDERIREALHIYLDWLDGRKDYAPKGEYTIRDMIAWLERQGEKGSAWSEEDEEELRIAVQYLQKAGQFDSVNWLKSLKTRTGG